MPGRKPPAPEDEVPSAARLPGKGELDRCRRCDLGARATQAVPGEGGVGAAVMLVGEQPGDEEDVAGKPFVGPAGRLLRDALASAGLDATAVYVTNAVKHFAWEPRGKRRIHKTPAQREVAACNVWLGQEIAAVGPRVIVALGATALAAVVGKRMTVRDARAATLTHAGGARIVATYHPSAALRAPDAAAREQLVGALVDDLRRAARLAAE